MLIRARTNLTPTNLAEQRRSHLGGVTVRVLDYQVDDGEMSKPLTDPFDIEACPPRLWWPRITSAGKPNAPARQLKTLQ
ncbi:hypothetical protein [Streptomyces syringium]|uniref:hypothetical protein n=1 Tax=Streptomyces syringium TaxID=76729 RepID=UPI00345133CF